MEGWGIYWSSEIVSAEALGCRVVYGCGWRYHKTCDCVAFPELPSLYAERLRLGSTTAGHVIKLAINSLYGKLAQIIGAAPFHNPIWAGLITAGVRAKLNRAIAQAPRSIVMIATDALYSRERLDLPGGPDKVLGEWETKEHPTGLFIVQPGVYWDEKMATIKTRGVSPGFFSSKTRRKRFERVWANYAAEDQATPRPVDPPFVELPLHLFVGARLAEARGNPDQNGCWMDLHKKFSFKWESKRAASWWQPGPCVMTGPLMGGSNWTSATHDSDPALIRVFENSGLELEDQPDYWQWEIEE